MKSSVQGVFVVLAGLTACALAVEPIFDLPHRGCYFTNWAQYRPAPTVFTASNMDPTLCTTITVAFANINSTYGLGPLEYNDQTTWATLASYKTNQPNLKILLSVGGATAALKTPLTTMAYSDSLRATFIASVVGSLRSWNLDGLDIDWEFPGPSDMTTYSTLLTQLRAAFEAESAQTGNQRLVLSAAIHLVSDGGFDGPTMNSALDIANVMTYDYDGYWDTGLSYTGHQSPLLVGPEAVASTLNIASVMQAWVAAGISPSKLVVGLPLYGRGWMLSSPSSNGLGAPISDQIYAGAYTQSVGMWAYFEICQNVQTAGATVVFNTTIQAAYAYTSSWWISYDNLQTITAKTQWTQANGYGGVYVWDPTQDDFANLCGQGVSPMLTAIRAILTGGTVPTQAPTTATTAPPTQAPTTATAATTQAQTTATTAGVTTTTPAPATTATPAATTTTTHAATTAPATTGGTSGPLACGPSVCLQPGVTQLGNCLANYCQCGNGNTGNLLTCPAGLVFDISLRYCNYIASAAGCPGSG